ncbi:MAG: sorbosone dehydrogenase family protein [Gemmatimonadetes bacterium]|nr:sorbosone dehydrogenase family protein [Gemmatimonadota bacterium]
MREQPGTHAAPRPPRPPIATRFLSAAGLGAALACGSGGAGQDGPLAGYVQQPLDGHVLTLPTGFTIAVYAEQLPGVRLMALGPDGDVYATLPELGRVVRLGDADQDGTADRVTPVAEGLNLPHGLAFRGDTLYVAESHRVVRFDRPGAGPTIVVANLPADGGHFTRTILIQGERLFVSVGSSCNICDERDPRRAAVVRYHLDGSGETLFATGLRNAVGLTLHPATGEIWATNNDRDNLGDDLPPDRVNILREGGFYGWPFCYLPNQPNPEYQRTPGRCANAIGPAIVLPAHTAPLGLAFYQGAMFPAEYRGDLFIALHGSWNRSAPIGYEVVRVDFENGRPVRPPQPFVSGWLEGRRGAINRVAGVGWGRPVDVLVLPDGSLLISDDESGRIYRVTYRR